jgi:hypothetical protein
MEGLKQRFPDDIAYTVFFDNTVFVTDTVAEVYAPCCCGAAMERSAGPCAPASIPRLARSAFRPLRV